MRTSNFLHLKLDLYMCGNPGSNQGPLDLQSNALPTELFRHEKPLLWRLAGEKQRYISELYLGSHPNHGFFRRCTSVHRQLDLVVFHISSKRIFIPNWLWACCCFESCYVYQAGCCTHWFLQVKVWEAVDNSEVIHPRFYHLYHEGKWSWGVVRKTG